MEKRIYLASPTMHEWERKFVTEAFDTNWIAPVGPHVNAFESEMADYVGEGLNMVALSAATAAIHLALKLLKVSQGDVVFCQSLTFAATCNPIVYENATPVFIDSDTTTWNMDPEALRKAFKTHPHPKAVIPVHLYGNPAQLDELRAICDEHGVPMIEDAAESLSSTYKGKQTGTFGDIGIFSFNGNKIITTSGGGMLGCRNKEWADKVRFWSTQSRDPARHYQHSEIGYNYRLSNVLAGIGRGQMKSLELHKELKQKLYKMYEEAFCDIDAIKMQPLNVDGDSNCWLSCITIDPESKVTPLMVMEALDAHNIESRPIWKPMHLQPVYAQYDFFTCKEEGSNSEDIFNYGLCLPSDIKNTEEDNEKIVNIIKNLF